MLGSQQADGVGPRSIGVDGSWSTFPIGVGTPPQTVQLLVSTSQPASWAVSPRGCGGSDDTDNCTQARGGAFDPSKSSTWFRKDIYQLNAAINLGYGGDQQNGTYGFDKFAFTSPGGQQVSIDHQVVANIATDKFYLGTIGLAPQVVNFSNSGDNSPSLITSLKDQNLIPSLSYGYTAGAYYRECNAGGVVDILLTSFRAKRRRRQSHYRRVRQRQNPKE